MIQWTGAKRFPLFPALFLAVGLFGACGGSVRTLEALPEAMRGKVRIVDVRVESRRGIASSEVEPILRQAFLEALAKKPEDGQATNLVVLIEDYVGPVDQTRGTRASGLGGIKSRLEGHVYLVDRETGRPFAEFRHVAQHQPGELNASGSSGSSADLRRSLIDQFVAAVLEVLS